MVQAPAGLSVIRSVIRLTIDSRGIREVERLPRLPTGADTDIQRYDDRVLVVQEDTGLGGVIAHLKVSIYRFFRGI